MSHFKSPNFSPDFDLFRAVFLCVSNSPEEDGHSPQSRVKSLLSRNAQHARLWFNGESAWTMVKIRNMSPALCMEVHRHHFFWRWCITSKFSGFLFWQILLFFFANLHKCFVTKFVQAKAACPSFVWFVLWRCFRLVLLWFTSYLLRYESITAANVHFEPSLFKCVLKNHLPLSTSHIFSLIFTFLACLFKVTICFCEF